MKSNILILSLLVSSAFAQVGQVSDLDESSLLNLPVGTRVSFDGKTLAQKQRNCPNKEKVKMLIRGKETEVMRSSLLFSDGKVKCSGGTDLALIYTDLTGRYVSIKGQVQDKSPLTCTVKEVTEYNKSISIYLSAPCNFAMFFKRSYLDIRPVESLTVKSFKYNLGKHVSFNINETIENNKEVLDDQLVKEINHSDSSSERENRATKK